jgi:hypothetical protein
MNSNGNEFSWMSYRVRAAGVEITDIKSVSWDHEVEGADPVYGASRKPRGRVAGRYKPGDSSITFYLSGWKAFLAALPNGYTDVLFEVVEQYREGSDIHETVLEECRILGGGGKAEEGTDPSEKEVKISFLRAIEDGKELVADVL